MKSFTPVTLAQFGTWPRLRACGQVKNLWVTISKHHPFRLKPIREPSFLMRRRHARGETVEALPDRAWRSRNIIQMSIDRSYDLWLAHGGGGAPLPRRRGRQIPLSTQLGYDEPATRQERRLSHKLLIEGGNPKARQYPVFMRE